MRDKKRTKKPLPKEIAKIVDQIKRRYKPEKIILYGSYAQGKQTRDSDIDMLIIKKTKKRFIERISDVLLLCDYDIPIEPIVYTPQEVAARIKLGDFFIVDIIRKGKVIYG